MIATIKGWILGPIFKVMLKKAGVKLDSYMDTPEEREANAEMVLEKYHDDLKRVLVKAQEKGHKWLDDRGY